MVYLYNPSNYLHYWMFCWSWYIQQPGSTTPGCGVLGGARRVGRLALAQGVRGADDASALTPSAAAAHAVVLLGAFALRPMFDWVSPWWFHLIKCLRG